MHEALETRTPRASDPGPTLPRRFGSYLVVRQIGRGGMATVLEARHEKLGGRAALKVLDPALAAQPLAAARFQREARAAAGLRHEHLLHVFDIGVEDGMPYLVMELLEGDDLATYLARCGTLSVAKLLGVFLPVISAVAAAHEAGIVHRDLKPANVMLARRPPLRLHPVVLDFGISKLRDDDGEGALTHSESLLGTVQYMAPELTRGARFASPASDQYAIGVMLYECATGRRPFRGDGHYELLHAIVSAPVVPPGRLRPELPPELDDIVMRALSRDPEQRFSSMRALAAALLSLGGPAIWERWSSEFPDAARTKPSSEHPVGTLRDEELRRPLAAPNLRRWVLAGVVLGAVLAALFVFVFEGRLRPAEKNARVVVPRQPLAQKEPQTPAPLAPPVSTSETLGGSKASERMAIAPPVAPTLHVQAAPTSRRAPGASAPKDTPPAEPAALPRSPAVILGKNGSPILE